MQISPYWRSFLGAGALVSMLLIPALADTPTSVNLPQPLPTNAANARTQALEAFGDASVECQPGDLRQQNTHAFEAARLDCLYDLCLKAEAGFRAKQTVQIDDLHEPLLLLGWLRQTKTKREHRSGKKHVYVRSDNSSYALFEERPPKGNILYRCDVDNDGQPDSLVLGPDSCISVVSQDRVLGKTDSIGSFHGYKIGNAPDSPRHIDYTEVQKVVAVQRLSPERINIIVEVKVSESLGQRLVGSYVCNRNYPLDVSNVANAPSVVIDTPRSARVNSLKKVPLSGVVDAPAGIAKANLLLNGKEVWNIPEGLQLRQLTLDLALDLNPGANELKVNVWDKDERNFTKSVRFMAPPSAKVTSNRALLVGVDSEGIQAVTQARELLIQRGYTVKTLRGTQATRDEISKAMDAMVQSCQSGDRVLVYFAGLTDWNGKERVFVTADSSPEATATAASLLDSDWSKWQGALAPYRTCYIFDTAATPALREKGLCHVQDMRLLYELRGLSNQVITGGNPSTHLGVGSPLNRALMQAWKGKPKVDIFDLNRQAYASLCQNGEVLPQFAGY